MLIGDYPRQRIPPHATRRPTPIHNHASVGVVALAFLVFLLVVPTFALMRLTTLVDWRILLMAPVSVSVLTYFAYRHDKRRAEVNDWRISEQTLHILELVGGWPGAFLAQRRFRHKTAKTSYQISFWSIVALHQLIALDSLYEWHFTRILLANIRT